MPQTPNLRRDNYHHIHQGNIVFAANFTSINRYNSYRLILNEIVADHNSPLLNVRIGRLGVDWPQQMSWPVLWCHRVRWPGLQL